MKWFFAVNELTLTHFDHDFPGLMLAATASARRNTSLTPYLIYDGGENDTINQLRAMGVTIVPHRITYHAQLEAARRPDYNMLIAAGAFLRSEIPRLEHQDEFVLYTDCDVIFRSQPSFLSMKPAFFASAPETQRDSYEDLNTGVMLMNVNSLRDTLGEFLHYVVTNFNGFVAYDQCAYKQFYAGRYDLLPSRTNWKPYWGWNDDAEIVHFHGPKPEAIRKIVNDPNYAMSPGWLPLYNRDPSAYQRYLAEWESFRAEANVAVAA